MPDAVGENKKCKKEIHDILAGLNVKPGDVIYLGIDIGRMPLPKIQIELNRQEVQARNKRWCAFVLDSLLSYLGPQGTLLAPAFSYSSSKPGSVFVLEDTPSEVGPFTEYFRAHKKTIRSVHPIFSVSGCGAYAADILNNCGRSAFGTMSVFERLKDFGVKFVCLGTNIENSLTYIHHLEQTYGCNHRFNKVFDLTVKKGGQTVKGPWLAYVAFRSIKPEMQCASLEDELLTQGALQEYEWNERTNQCVNIADLRRVGYEMLKDNPCAFMDQNIVVALEEDAGITKPVTGPKAVFDLIPR
jgi:aminoglycoside 3-N-acetyltransferase